MVIVRLSGGMGNQMFEYANGRALSLKHNVPLSLDLTMLLDRTPRPAGSNAVFRDYDLDVFNVKAEIVSRSQIPLLYRKWFNGNIFLRLDAIRKRFLKTKGVERGFHYNKEVSTFGPNVYLEGEWQSPKYFADIEATIREDFTLKSPMSEKSEALRSEIKNTNSLAVNVRRADFVKSDFHGTFESAYYDTAIEMMTKRQTIEKIYVFSDDMKWCEENLHFKIPTVFVGHEYKGKKFEEYLYLMAACKHFIIPNSSFAWWAAWFAENPNKTIIAPKRWFLNESINTTDLIPKDWIRI